MVTCSTCSASRSGCKSFSATGARLGLAHAREARSARSPRTRHTRGVLMNNDAWPELQQKQKQKTNTTKQKKTQIVGKICLELTPRVNHFWIIAFQVSSRDQTTPAMPCGGQRTLNLT